MRKRVSQAAAIVFLLFLSLYFSEGHSAGRTKPAHQIKNAMHAKTLMHTKAKITNAEYAKWSKPFPLLKFNQLSRLEFSQRVKYIREIRRVALEIEKSQFMFRDSKKFAELDLPKHDGAENELFALIRGDFINFAAADGDGGRGRNITDKCIFAYNLSKYPKAGVRQPFECEIPASAKCTGANGPGVQCGYYLSGLNGSVDRACISDNVRYKATQECDAVRTRMSKENFQLIDNTVANAEKYFGFKEPGTKISKSDLTNDEAQKILKALADNAYDDKVYAELVYVLSYYKKHGIQPPLASLGEQYAKISPDNFEKNYDSLQTSMNQVFGDYINHCDHKLDANEVAKLRDPKWAKQAKQMGRAAWILEKQRIDAVKQLDSHPDSEYLVKNILEIPECRAIEARRDQIASNLQNVVGSYPDLQDDAPIANNPPAPHPVIPPRPKPELPPANSADDGSVKTTGCSTNVTEEEHQLHQAAARCVACLAERSMAKSARNESDPVKKREKETYSVSTKWLSLMSSMALACGDGFSNSSNLNPEIMIRYMQTFGHCSADTYDWDPSERMSENDKKRIEEWSTQDFWVNKDRMNDTDVNKNFERIYGISYSESTKLFCHRDRYRKWFFNLFGKVTGPNERKEPPPVSVQMQDGRRRMKEYLADDGKFWGPKIPPALKQCMQEAEQSTKELYSGTGGNTCVKTVPYKTATQSQMNALFNDIDLNGGTAVISDGSKCWVAKQIEKTTKDGRNLVNIGLVDPSQAADASEAQKVAASYRLLGMWRGKGADGKIKRDADGKPVYYEPALAAYAQGKPLSVDHPDQYFFTMPDDKMCKVAAAAPVTQGDSHGESK